MTFIPIVHTVQAQQPSPKARELNQLLSHAVREYRSRHPEISPEEVRQAVELTRQEVATSSGTDTAVVIGIGLLVLGLVLFLGLLRNGGSQGFSVPLPIAGVLGALVIGGVMFLVARSRRP